MTESRDNSLEQENKNLRSELEKVSLERDKYKALFDTSADALSIIDLSTGKFIECNQAAIDMHGVESEKNFLNLVPADISPVRQPCGKSSQEMAVDYITKTFQEGPQAFQWTHSKLDGSEFPCLVSLTAIPLGDKQLVLAIGRDITELAEAQVKFDDAFSDAKKYEAAYLNEKQKFEHFVNLAPVGIAINSFKDGVFHYVNKEFSRFTGYEVEELNLMDYWQLTPQKYEEQEQEQLRDLTERGGYGPYKKEYIHSEGHAYPVLLSGIKITGNDNEEYIWSVVQDISLQQQTEDKIREAQHQAESANKAKSLFLSNMSHEVRTPMNGILGTLQLIQSELQSTTCNRLIEQAIFSANSLLTIVNDILDYSKIESNALSIETVSFSIQEVIESISSDLHTVAINKGIMLNVDLANLTCDYWYGDPVRVRQIVINLMSNAIKFTEKGKVKVTVGNSNKNQINGLLIKIVDTGIGISEQAKLELFERFTQADPSITRKYGGTGLGMSITKNLIMLMNGDITVESEQGKGTEVNVFLPLIMDESANDTEKSKPVLRKTPDLRGKKILVAEDNMVNKEIIRSMLEKTFAELYFAENGKTAVESFRSFNPDIVLMDIQMPVMDGKEAFKQIRKLDKTTPIIVITANVMTQDVKDYSDLGFNACIGKPFKVKELYETIDSYINL